ncbi:uncharacterized protein B0H18DRAFT_162320 [Fomitopsis serialis]|uniref:uncharacterized protein n=1 Tax=Fomitopsis serialis TaxID=139415 RepID=UPI002007FFAE|nr:uncharacterized protein B0H18DRAFT_162320 [Neoantrodia serialis]KAH9930127.1 hypothetical protein B0H18DRAFT_162320 [Neoantrodia serialis]
MNTDNLQVSATLAHLCTRAYARQPISPARQPVSPARQPARLPASPSSRPPVFSLARLFASSSSRPLAFSPTRSLPALAGLAADLPGLPSSIYPPRSFTHPPARPPLSHMRLARVPICLAPLFAGRPLGFPPARIRYACSSGQCVTPSTCIHGEGAANKHTVGTATATSGARARAGGEWTANMRQKWASIWRGRARANADG